MHFSKILPVTLFAALAVAAPAPQGVSATTEQIQQFSDSVQSFASNTDSSFSELNAQKDALASAWGGEGSVSLNRLVPLVRSYLQSAASTGAGF